MDANEEVNNEENADLDVEEDEVDEEEDAQPIDVL